MNSSPIYKSLKYYIDLILKKSDSFKSPKLTLFKIFYAYSIVLLKIPLGTYGK